MTALVYFRIQQKRERRQRLTTDKCRKKQKRAYADEIMEASQYVIFEKNEKMVGRTFRVMVDGFLPEENIYVGRTYGDAPEVDGCIFFECVSELVSGTINTGSDHRCTGL